MEQDTATMLAVAHNNPPPEHANEFNYSTLERPIAEAAIAAERAIKSNLRQIREAIFEIGGSWRTFVMC